MTPARIRALQWFYDLGEAGPNDLRNEAPSLRMRRLMFRDGQIEAFFRSNTVILRLTDKGRRDLHEATRP